MPRGDFRFTSQKVHLTYKTHVDFESIKELCTRTAGGYSCISMVHERGDTDEENATPYDHTHVAVHFKQRPDIADARYFDLAGIHPHMQTKRSAQWFRHIVQVYHKGHKVKSNGKKYFIAPVALEQENCEQYFGNEELIDTIIGAPSLKDALLDTGIMPKSVSDVSAMRKECKRKAETAIEDGIDLKRFKTFEWNRKKALVLKGLPNCGKTNWAISQFESPMLICDLDQLKDITPATDGLIFDEMLFEHIPKQGQIYLLDIAMDRTIRTRHSNAVIPRGMPRIFTCNEHEYIFGGNPHESVKRRYNTLEITEPMYE